MSLKCLYLHCLIIFTRLFTKLSHITILIVSITIYIIANFNFLIVATVKHIVIFICTKQRYYFYDIVLCAKLLLHVHYVRFFWRSMVRNSFISELLVNVFLAVFLQVGVLVDTVPRRI